MFRTTRPATLALAALLAAAPALATAQPGAPGAPQGVRAPQGRGLGPGAVTRLLDARRQLDLTPRQVAQLDSLERLQVAERRAFAERMRPQRDSLMRRAREGARTPALRDSLRAQARARQEANRPQVEQFRKRDSALNAAAERILNDTQRQKVRELQAERRGFERGLRAGRQQGGRFGPRGDRPGGQVGPGGRQGGQWGPQGGQFGSRGGQPRPMPRRPMPPEGGER